MTNSSYFEGKFDIAVVDDVEIVRKLLRRRLKQIFPQAHVTEFDCGEKVIEVCKEKPYDMIFIDQFMGDGLKGDETILQLRKININSYIVGISGNQKDVCHLTAGGDDFFQKPLPSQKVLMQRFCTKVTIPYKWRIMIADTNSLSSTMLKRKLHRVATVHPTASSNIEKLMFIEECQTIEVAQQKVKSEWYDLVILASHEFHCQKKDPSGVDLVHFIRNQALNKTSIIVLNSGHCSKEGKPDPYNIFWPKPLPSLEVMRRSLVEELVKI